MRPRYTKPNYRRKIFTSRKPAISPRWPTAFEDEQSGWPKIAFGALLITCAAWFYLTFYSHFFAVSKVEIIGPNEEINSLLAQKIEDLKNQRLYFILRRNNIFLFKLSESQQITQGLGLEQIMWSKNKLDRAVFISYEEKQPKLIEVYQNQPHYLDQYAEEIKKLNPYMEISNLPTLFIQDTANIMLVNADLIKKIYQINSLADKIHLKISAYKIDKLPEVNFKKATDSKTPINTPELVATTQNTWDIHFGPEILNGPGILDKQLYNLEVLHKTKLNKIDPKNIKYIDLRFGDKVFYK